MSHDRTIRTLPPDEWDRLLTFEPFRSGGLPDPTFWRIIVAEQAGAIVGFLGIWTAIHTEPFYLAPDVRHQPQLFMGMWAEAQRHLAAAGATMVFATVDDDQPDLQRLWEKFGFVGAPGRLFVGDLTQLPT